jgi:hypothetical protein
MALAQLPERGHELRVQKALRPQALDEEASRLVPLAGVITCALPLFHASDVPPTLKGSHYGSGIPPKLVVVPSVRLSRGLKLGLEIASILSEVGGEMATPVAINRALAEAVLSGNGSHRLSR